MQSRWRVKYLNTANFKMSIRALKETKCRFRIYGRLDEKWMCIVQDKLNFLSRYYMFKKNMPFS